jgi:RsiW-degrading membrane proteinase PrsW (M82 family)
MPGIYIMAALTLCGTAALAIPFLNHQARSDRRYVWLIAAGLPLSLLVNRFIKTPVIVSLAAWAGIPLKIGTDAPLWFILAVWLNAPVFEEAIKALPIAFPRGRVFLRDASQALPAGLALGIGFGLGEAAYLAYGIAQSPDFNQLPWYLFTGYALERLVVTFAHGFMTAIAVAGMAHHNKRRWIGYLTAVGLHALINLGPILLALKLVPGALASLGSYLVIAAAFVIFQNTAQKARATSGNAPKEIIYFEG